MVYRGLGILAEIYAVIQDRRARPAEGSYVAGLLSKGPDQALKKLAEEAAEVLLAAKGENREQIIYEMADLWFHSLVVLAQHEIRPEEIAQELGRRFGKRKGEYA
jgi:phosphoribosyl-ATP pyrophosphohydrolase